MSEQKEYIIKLAEPALDYIMNKLALCPWGEVDPLIKGLMEQANNQPIPLVEEVKTPTTPESPSDTVTNP